MHNRKTNMYTNETLPVWENEGGNLGLKLKPCPLCHTGFDLIAPGDVWPDGIPPLACVLSTDVWGLIL